MSKRTIKVLSLILTLVMFLSVSTPGFAWGGGIGIGDGWGRDIGEDEVRDFEPEGEIEEKEEYDYFSAFDEESGINVVVEAPMGSLPLLAELRVEPVDAEAIRDAVNSVVEGEPEILVAMDISFWLDDIKIEPEEPVRVKIAAPELEGKSNLTLVHIPDEAEPETLDLLPEEELSFKLGTNEICFESGEFSVYAVTWSGGTTNIHFGTLNGGSFTEFDDTVSLDSSAASMNLNVRFEDYEYTGAYYEADGVRVELASSILTKVTTEDGTAWTMQVRVTSGEGEDEQVLIETRTLEGVTDIYAFYSPKGAGYTPPSPAPVEVKGPITDKHVSANGDGTYQIRLDITGQVDHTETRVGANVIIVFDNTKSMRYLMDGTDPGANSNSDQQRIDFMRPALRTLINTLDPDVNTINLAFAIFNLNGSLHSWGNNSISGLTHWTQDKQTMLAYTNSNDLSPQNNSAGTNWEIGLDQGLILLDEAQNANNTILNANKTYIIFVTDGDPNRWVGYNYSNNEFNHYDEAVTNAQDEANEMVTRGAKLYGIFCGSSSGQERLELLITTAGGEETIAATNEAEINAAFQGIATTIVNDLGASNVTADDGIPQLADVSASVSGQAGGYKYYISYPLTLVTQGAHAGEYSYTYKDDQGQPVTAYVAASNVAGAVDRNAANYSVEPGYTYVEDESHNRIYYKTEVWEDAPSAGYSSSNGVTWDLSDAGVLADETIYTITFDVWPSQEAYDLLANLNNKMPGWTLDKLDDATLEQMVVTLNGSDYGYTPGATEGTGTWSNGTTTYASTDAFLVAINAALQQDENAVYYNILTNTHLYTTYEYDGQEYNDPPEHGLVSGAMVLEDQTIGIVKYWHNDLDALAAEDISLTITRDGEHYMDVVMGSPVKIGEHEWKQEPDVDLYISCGIMTVDDQNNLTMNTTGHDYSVIENDGSPWYWDLTAYVYHPMVVNAENTMLILVTDEDQAKPDFPAAAKNLENNKRIQAGGKWYYKFDNKLYVQTDGATNILRADNDRRSNLQIAKTVTGDDAPEDELFTFEVTMENEKTPYVGDEEYNSDYHTFWFVVLNDPNNYCDLATTAANFLDPENPAPGTIVWEEDGLVVDGATAEIGELRTDDSTISNIQTHAADDTHPCPYITYTKNSKTYTVKAVDLQQHTGTETIDNEGTPTTHNYTYYSYYTGYYSFDNVKNGRTVTVSIKAGWRICFTSITKNTSYTIEEPTEDLPDGFVLNTVTTSAHCNKAGETATAGVVNPDEDNPAIVKGSIDASNSDYRVYYSNRFVGFFYVYHSSDCTLERFPFATDGVVYSEDKTFDIASLTADGTLYGGYYSDYAGKTSGFDANAAKALDYSDKANPPKDADGTAYSTEYIRDSNRGAWSSSATLTVNGFEMVPAANTVYYLKEVPTAYLQPYFHYTYSKETFDIYDGWLISAIDDCLYQETGFIIVSENDEARVCSTLTVKTTQSGGTTVLLKPEGIFRSRGVKSGYLSYLQVLKDGSPTLMDEAERVLQYWITPDGLIVTGTTSRTYAGLDNKNNLGKTDTTVATTVTAPGGGELPSDP
ncbi:MAG: VWA domain-containing protein [Oscillospiraceae bacterium]|nr:VWA domain-containing protein [Oscillospiraceae bacterium]